MFPHAICNGCNTDIDLADRMPAGICNNCLEQIEQLDWIKRRIKTSNNLLAKFLTMRKDAREPKCTRSGSPGPALVSVEAWSMDNISEDSTEVKIEQVFTLNGFHDPQGVEELQKTPVKSQPLIEEKASPVRACRTTAPLRKGYRCDRCDTVFLNRWSLNSHHDYCRKRIKCLECGKCFWHTQLYIRHKKQSALCVRKKAQRSCFDCRLVFRWKWQLMYHVLSHDMQTCQLCDKVVYSEQLLKQHVLQSHMDFGF